MASLFFSSAAIENINALTGIVGVNEIFFWNPLNGSVISYMGKIENAGDEEIKGNKE